MRGKRRQGAAKQKQRRKHNGNDFLHMCSLRNLKRSIKSLCCLCIGVHTFEERKHHVGGAVALVKHKDVSAAGKAHEL